MDKDCFLCGGGTAFQMVPHVMSLERPHYSSGNLKLVYYGTAERKIVKNVVGMYCYRQWPS
jgi:hypothetical protein